MLTSSAGVVREEAMKVDLVSDVKGGTRAIDEKAGLKCPEGCKKSTIVQWRDYVVYHSFGQADPPDHDYPPEFPDPPDGIDLGGICELKSDLIEYVFCVKGNANEYCGNQGELNLLERITIAFAPTDNSVLCRKDAFRPFKRRADGEPPIAVREGDSLYKGEREKSHLVEVSGRFVRNFLRKDMTIEGPEWLSLYVYTIQGEDVAVYLYGDIPTTGTPMEYSAKVTATNGAGSDYILLKISVSL
jgi:hypothetical protein